MVPILSSYGGIAQLGERQLCKLDVRGSSPLTSTTNCKGPHNAGLFFIGKVPLAAHLSFSYTQPLAIPAIRV